MQCGIAGVVVSVAHIAAFADQKSSNIYTLLFKSE
jgi:hypothetical protein